jgi:hypothetical protein
MGLAMLFALRANQFSAGKNFRTASISNEPSREFKTIDVELVVTET